VATRPMWEVTEASAASSVCASGRPTTSSSSGTPRVLAESEALPEEGTREEDATFGGGDEPGEGLPGDLVAALGRRQIVEEFTP
jgi:hypothetical protein